MTVYNRAVITISDRSREILVFHLRIHVRILPLDKYRAGLLFIAFNSSTLLEVVNPECHCACSAL